MSPIRSLLCGFVLFAATLTPPTASADTPPPGWTANNVDLLGYTIMNEHPAFKITMARAGDRWYITGGHYNIPGWSVVDVTDPRNPHVVKFIPGPPNTSTNQVDSADGILVAALGRPNARGDAGMTAAKPYSAGVMLIDMEDVLVDTRGDIYVTGGAQQGLHVLRYTGPRK